MGSWRATNYVCLFGFAAFVQRAGKMRIIMRVSSTHPFRASLLPSPARSLLTRLLRPRPRRHVMHSTKLYRETPLDISLASEAKFMRITLEVVLMRPIFHANVHIFLPQDMTASLTVEAAIKPKLVDWKDSCQRCMSHVDISNDTACVHVRTQCLGVLGLVVRFPSSHVDHGLCI
jgi:hypothetical protein